MFETVSFNFCIFLSVTEGLSELQHEDANKYYKIIFIKSGPCHFLLNDKEFLLTGTCAICMNEKDKIVFYKTVETGTKILWFRPTVINLELTCEVLSNPQRNLTTTNSQDVFFLRQFLKEASESDKIISLHSMDAAGFEYKFNILNEILTKQTPSTWPCVARSYLFEILFCISRQEENEQTSSNTYILEGSSRLAVDAVYYLKSCYNEKITIEKLSEKFHTNRTTLLNDFKKYTGQSVNQYLIELRITMASTLLRDTELSVDEICDRTGFSDVSYFSKVFKKKLLHTPSEYRRINHHAIY